jgi:hypothetical protein
MKSWIILAITAVAITAVVTIAVPFLSADNSLPRSPEFPAPIKTDGPSPKLVIDGPLTFDFGTLGQQTQRSHQWTFRNEGTSVLQVRGSTVTCSCTTSDLFEGADLKTGKQVEIAPGGSRQVTVNWDTKKFENHYRQVVSIGTNDPDRPSVDLAIEGTIKLALITDPSDAMVSFMNANNGEPLLRRVFLASPDRPETRITRIINSNPDRLAVDTREAAVEDLKRFKVEKGFYIEITLKPCTNLGDFTEEIMVETDHPLRKNVPIRIKGKISGPISLIPEKVEMRNATSKEGGSQALTVWVRNQSEVHFTVDKKPAGMDVEFEPLTTSAAIKGSSYRMKVKLAPGLDPGPLEGEIVLKTDDPKASEIHVPVSILIKGEL